jgi:hypothetical protein
VVEQPFDDVVERLAVLAEDVVRGELVLHRDDDLVVSQRDGARGLEPGPVRLGADDLAGLLEDERPHLGRSQFG